ncbi:hypothetical protein [Agromyces sp. NPDC058104]|uniref:hypothetical protein n=1 Tax=Agromyces sp. NPDC058104 TaxID=3346342 RepID=UPI0036DC68B2
MPKLTDRCACGHTALQYLSRPPRRCSAAPGGCPCPNWVSRPPAPLAVRVMADPLEFDEFVELVGSIPVTFDPRRDLTKCDGTAECWSTLHVHGCFSDDGSCIDKKAHAAPVG